MNEVSSTMISSLTKFGLMFWRSSIHDGFPAKNAGVLLHLVNDARTFAVGFYDGEKFLLDQSEYSTESVDYWAYITQPTERSHGTN